ncbi:MAG: hypothetical protein KF734_08880 [Saprospiraceae bacterium]|nr:hypothetical protein [Saprospiraceae bacterium]
MRKTIFLLQLFFSLSLNAQVEFAPLGAVWHYDFYPIGPPIVSTYVKVEVTGLGFIQGKLCKRVVSAHSGCADAWGEVYMYEEAGKVYRLLNGQFQLFIDFNAGPGEGWSVVTNAPYGNDTLMVQVDSVSYVTYDGMQLKVQHVSYPNLAVGEPNGSIMEWGHTFTERLGNSQYMYPQVGVCDPPVFGIRCYEDSEINQSFVSFPCDTTTFYSSVRDIEVLARSGLLFPNPAHTSVSVTSEVDADEVVFQNLIGVAPVRRRLGQSMEIEIAALEAGLYFAYLYRREKLVGIDKLVISRR